MSEKIGMKMSITDNGVEMKMDNIDYLAKISELEKALENTAPQMKFLNSDIDKIEPHRVYDGRHITLTFDDQDYSNKYVELFFNEAFVDDISPIANSIAFKFADNTRNMKMYMWVNFQDSGENIYLHFENSNKKGLIINPHISDENIEITGYLNEWGETVNSVNYYVGNGSPFGFYIEIDEAGFMHISVTPARDNL